ncbi:hypothetical protein TVAG_013590 [Trichomonas vaginalis G3]|uniref:Right handed beta helix domain-containing protein n=1 Tax=Trichomonas vaginalis (strain ATCC PRA-98 / G3) TaxID=412133 RepID=A2DDB5_TRIV3|nr:hypothetical protein TVAGG3_0986750 [Trichomonas vaginalis G3]EAY21594.1 hypothetical protein TVAG_013590 [Trichomonas vaginalis G3]KAI5489730.1 hypothetical protein TVAGG3_0986750 [Trichomonas vaginalis G3]|eukprot:XP_001582580.1 hypothetical protein [Trichomonas vaginalis G3]
MKGGKQIINLCNITSNRVDHDIAGYCMDYVISDSFVQFTTIRSNNQTKSDSFALNLHSSSKLISVLSCNYIENIDSSGVGKLIWSNTKLYMFGCCIVKNVVKYVICNQGNSFVVNNTYTEISETTSNSVVFTNIISNTECKHFIVKFINQDVKEVSEDDDPLFIKEIQKNVRYLNKRPKIIYFVLP